MLINAIAKTNSVFKAVSAINEMDQAKLPVLLGEISLLLNDDKAKEKAKELSNKPFFLKAIQKVVSERIENMSFAKPPEEEILVTTFGTVLSAYQYRQYCLNPNWSLFINVSDKHQYFYNENTLAIVQYRNNHVVTTQYKNPMNFWAKVSEFVVIRNRLPEFH